MKVEIQSKNGHKVVDLNRRKAIREKCLNCSGYSYVEVECCNFTDCPLHRFRTGRGVQNSKLRIEAIHKYCLWCMNGNKAEISKCVSRDCPLFPYRKSTVDKSVEFDPIAE